MLVVSKEFLKRHYVMALFDINKAIFEGKGPGSADYCIALGASLSSTERDLAHDECRKLLNKAGIVFKDERVEK